MKRAILLLIIFVLTVTCFCGCNSEKTQLSIYFKDAQTNELNEEKHDVKTNGKNSAQVIAKLAVGEIISGPVNEKNAPVISKDAKLISLAVNNGVATVNMSKHFSEKTGVDGLILRYSFINTLCSVDGIDGIVIQVEGKPLLSEATGAELGVLSMEDIVLDTEDLTMVKLYFPGKNGDKLVGESRAVENALSLEKTVVNELIKGPKDRALSASIPEGTKLLSIETKDKICYVNFSSEFKLKTASGSSATTLTLYSVVNSLCALESVESVQILINGETGVEFGNYVLDIPYEANLNLN